MPPHATDAHCHVFGPGNMFPYAPDRRYTPDDAPKEMLRALHDHLGIERAVIVQASCHGTDNAAMLDCIASDRPAIAASPLSTTVSPTGFRSPRCRGVRGVRFNFVKHLGGAPDMAVFARVIDRIKGRGWHVVLLFRCARHRARLRDDPQTAAALCHRPHGPGAGERGGRSAAAARADRAFAPGKLLDQSLRRRAHFHAALCRRGADRAGLGGGDAGARAVGHRFSASQCHARGR